jgi:hypothetical protein
MGKGSEGIAASRGMRSHGKLKRPSKVGLKHELTGRGNTSVGTDLGSFQRLCRDNRRAQWPCGSGA